MTWSPDIPEDGDAVSASVVTALFTSAQSWLGAVTRAGLRRGTFNRFQAATLLQPFGQGYTVFNNESTNLIGYTRAVFTNSIKWVSWGHDAGSGDAGDLGTADRAVVGHESNTTSYTGSQAVLQFPNGGTHVGIDNGDNCSFILVMFNCQVMQAESMNAPVDLGIALSFSLQYEVNNNSSWHTVARSERWVSLIDHISDDTEEGEAIHFDVPITLALGPAILDADLAMVGGAAANPVTGVRAMVTAVAFANDGQANFIVDNFRLTAVPVMSEDT